MRGGGCLGELTEWAVKIKNSIRCVAHLLFIATSPRPCALSRSELRHGRDGMRGGSCAGRDWREAGGGVRRQLDGVGCPGGHAGDQGGAHGVGTRVHAGMRGWRWLVAVGW